MTKATPRTTFEALIQPPNKWWNLRFADLWQYRELLYFFTWRDLKVRYKQTALGVAWAIIQPLMSMVVISVVFGRFAGLPSEGPYPIFTYAALLPWQLFSRALSGASQSLISNQQMVSKTYFPRIFLPASTTLSSLVDFTIAFIILLGLLFYYGLPLTWRLLTLPVFVFVALISALGVGIWLSALNVKFRDVKYATPFLEQLWFYATPVAYASTLFPESWRPFLGLNPMAGVVEAFRWAILGQDFQSGSMIVVSGVVTLVLFLGGLIYFQNAEQTFADVI